MFSIIIPAHNEEKQIVSTLIELFDDQRLSRVNLFVVCNACSDSTAEKVNDFLNANNQTLLDKEIVLRVLHVDKASKTNAINLGLEHVTQGKVIFLDADIQISGKSIIELIENLEKKTLLAAAPKVRFDFSQSAFLVRLYYRMSSQSFYNQKHRLSNVIALSEEGRKRTGKLPEVIADDEYIRRRFTQSEYQIIPKISFEFLCPKTFSNLFNVLTRVERGNIQLAMIKHFDKSGANLNGFKQKPILSVPVFVLCKFFAKLRARWQFNKGLVNQWERDESNR